MQYQAVLFDMDGTVLDTLEDLYDSINHSLAHFSLPPVTRELVRQSLGNGAAFLVSRCVPADCSPELQAEVLAYYKPWYDAHCLIKTGPYDGILPMMHALKAAGLRLAIISNKPDPAVQELAAAFFPGLLELSVGESPAIRRKPAPDTVLAAAKQMDLLPSQCVYVGDTEVDIETARNAGMDCITVTWGFRDENQLVSSGATILVHNMEQLRSLLLSD